MAETMLGAKARSGEKLAEETEMKFPATYAELASYPISAIHSLLFLNRLFLPRQERNSFS